jgi:putative redox protein
MSNPSQDAVAPTPPAAGKPPARVTVTWAGEKTFVGGRAEGGPTIRLDNTGKAGPGPVGTLLIALVACTSEDILAILEKRRTPAKSLRVDVTGQRKNGVPARLTHIHLNYVIDGDGIEREHAERAIDLSITKYCSVRDSLDPAMPIEWSLELNRATAAARGGGGDA